ncbi:hypothetical protein ACFL57_04900 [Candidatus Margulisiibacteriota bacterium]
MANLFNGGGKYFRGSDKDRCFPVCLILFPFLVIMVLFVVEFCDLLHAMQTVEMIGEEAVVCVYQGKDDAEILQCVSKTVKTARLHPEILRVSVSPYNSQRKSGDKVTIKLTYPHTLKYDCFSLLKKLGINPYIIETERKVVMD